MSKSLVSLVLQGSQQVSSERRRAVVEAIEQLNGNSFLGAAVQIGLGAATVIFGKGSEFANSAGLGMAIGGGFRLLSKNMTELTAKTGVSVAGLDYMMPPSVLPRLNGIGSYNGGAIVVD